MSREAGAGLDWLVLAAAETVIPLWRGDSLLSSLLPSLGLAHLSGAKLEPGWPRQNNIPVSLFNYRRQGGWRWYPPATGGPYYAVGHLNAFFLSI